MKPRMEYWKIAPAAYKAMSFLEAYLRESGIEKPLLHMVKLRASHINGCAHCIDMHWKDARAVGESEEASTAWMPGAKPATTPTASEPRWNGPRP